MLTFTSTKNAVLRCSGGEKPLEVFPSGDQASDAINLLSTPEEMQSDGAFSWPGEYNRSGVTIRGIGHGEGEQVSFVSEIAGVRVAFLSAPLQEWNDHNLELLGDVDILVLTSENPKLIQKLLDEIDPRVLILKPSGDKKIDEEVVGICGAQDAEVTNEFKLKGSLPAEGRQMVVLK
jgi:hypothetical protein